ncbi:hypothetical protein RSOLAG22IIIB_05771 [Rhizoctonia solani]|uniref:Uncharacterized protein n=1 Tax=Rhizoctonia solani TaxID=456999 RepID=A0A0K6G9Q7_9AGAM|nr:hypothetical protein RSOLAG22IIIB_05771 [Rhizoctonia solani]
MPRSRRADSRPPRYLLNAPAHDRPRISDRTYAATHTNPRTCPPRTRTTSRPPDTIQHAEIAARGKSTPSRTSRVCPHNQPRTSARFTLPYLRWTLLQEIRVNCRNNSNVRHLTET